MIGFQFFGRGADAASRLTPLAFVSGTLPVFFKGGRFNPAQE
jgi:hypothetical protein